MDTTGGYLWDPLPAKKKSRRSTNAKNLANRPDISAGLDTIGSDHRNGDYQDINENISKRSAIVRAENSLEGKDGCAGEFYESCSQSASVSHALIPSFPVIRTDLDHTADVQCHAWGATFKEALQNMAPCMLNYMTDITKIHEDSEETIEIKVSGHDNQSLLYNYMNELLFKFSTDYFCVVRVEILDLNLDKYSIHARLYGEIFDLAKHSSGTEIKAITYSNMQIHQITDRCDLYVIVDI